MKPGLLRGSRYSPGNMDLASLEALFVGRGDILDDLLLRMSESTTQQSKRYVLLVGPRGSGKTHLLTLAYHRLVNLLDREHAREGVALALLNEEEWGVASYLDLVVRILRALAEDTPGLTEQVAQVYQEFSKDPADAESYAAELLREHTRGKTIVLFCENLVDLFHGIGEEGQKRWRASIQEDGNWAIVATTPALFDAVTLQDNPFYGFFTIRPLKQIDFGESLQLLAKKAVHEGKTELAGFLRTPLGRTRARAIHHLAAGNHRAYVVLFDFLDRESLEDLIGPFMHMVDDLTPYYQDKMRQLPPSQRKILEFLCSEGTPRTVKDISTPCLMSQQTAAKQLGELEKAGFVTKVHVGRNTFCELSEPLMRICIEVKDNKTQHFRLFVEFLRHWFSTHELERRYATYQKDGASLDLDRVHVREAVRCAHTDKQSPFVEALCEEAESCEASGDYKGLATIQRTIVRDRDTVQNYSNWVHALIMARDASGAVAAAEEATEKHPGDARLQWHLAHAYYGADRPVDALKAANEAIALAGERPAHLCIRADILIVLKRFEEAIADAYAVLDKDPDHWHSFEQIIEALVGQNQFREAQNRVEELLRLAPNEPEALRIAAEFHMSQNQLDAALQILEKIRDIDFDNDRIRRLRGCVLFEMERYKLASEEFRRVVVDEPRSVFAHCFLADSLLGAGEWEEALNVAEQLTAMDKSHLHGHYVGGMALMQLDRPKEAITEFDELLPSENYEYLLSAASCASKIEDHASAKRYLGRVSELQPASLGLWSQFANVYIDEGDFKRASECAAKAASTPRGFEMGRLLEAQVTAASQPLESAMELLKPVLTSREFDGDRPEFAESVARILSVSVRSFGPQFLEDGLAKLLELLKDRLRDGVVGKILTQFLQECASEGFHGSRSDWERALDWINTSTADLTDCQIPVQMLEAAVMHCKTGDEKHLLTLPLEQRKLVEDIVQ